MSGEATNGFAPKQDARHLSSFPSPFLPYTWEIASPIRKQPFPEITTKEKFVGQWEKETETASPKVIFATARAGTTASASGQARVVGGEEPMEERKGTPADAGQVALQVALDISRRMDAVADSLRQEFRAIRQELREDHQTLREDVKRELSELKQELREVRSDVNNRIQQSQNIVLIALGIATILLAAFSLMQR